MDKLKRIKVEQMNKIEELENIILELENLSNSKEESYKIQDAFRNIKSLNNIEKQIEFFKKDLRMAKENLGLIKDNAIEDNRLYLSEIIEKEGTKFKLNNLILAPVGSGKTTLITDVLIEDKEQDILMLVSTTSLKESISPYNESIKKETKNRTFTTRNTSIYGEKKYRIHVMSYAEFGSKVISNDDFVKKFSMIFCDEIHSLAGYEKIDNSKHLSHAIKEVFAIHERVQKFYFTATDEYLLRLQKEYKDILRDVEIYDYREHPEIKQYMSLSEYKFNHVEQIRPHLKARIKSFTYFGYKALAFSRTITGQKVIAEMAEQEGFTPLVLWSINNTKKENKMNKEQIEAREHLLHHGEIPKPYNFLIINSAMQEGWNLYDDKVKLAIMNTTSETEKIQALGRLRHDIDILAYKVNERVLSETNIEIPNEYLNVPLTSEKKEELSKVLKVVNAEGLLGSWRSIKPLIDNDTSIYHLKDHVKMFDGKRKRVTTITLRQSQSTM